MTKYSILFVFLFSFLLVTNITFATDTPTSNLSLGMRGEQVKNLQILLEVNGYLDSGNRTGYFGQKTLQAVAWFQKSNRINPTGFFGKLSRQKLNEINSNTISVGGDRDAQGCLIAAGYTWDKTFKKCVRPWEKILNQIGGRLWKSFEMDKNKMPGLTFSIKDGRLSMKGCNSMSGTIEIDEVNKTIKTGPMMSTLMACMETEKMQLDQIASSVFASATVEMVSDDAIKISNKEHYLLFAPAKEHQSREVSH